MEKQEIHNLIKELITKTVDVSGEISVTEEGPDGMPHTTWFSVETKHPHLYLNKEGEALSALNYLARKIVENKIFYKNQTENEQLPRKHAEILIDINNFQKNKIENIHNVVHMMAERARYFKSNIEIDPMSAFERRIVHEFLSTATDLKTESEGVGPNRRVVIKYIGSL